MEEASCTRDESVARADTLDFVSIPPARLHPSATRQRWTPPPDVPGDASNPRIRSWRDVPDRINVSLLDSTSLHPGPTMTVRSARVTLAALLAVAASLPAAAVAQSGFEGTV